MRKTALLLALFLVAGGAAAQEQSAPAESETRRPDYSRSSLMRLFAEAGNEDDDRRTFRYRDGSLEIRAGNTTVRLLRVLVPLSGSEVGTVMNAWPDPFALTGTQIATSRRAWRTERALSAEMRRIDATERARIRVTTR